MADDLSKDLETGSKFMIEIDGISIMAFEKCTLGDSEWGKIESRTGLSPLSKEISSGIKTTTMLTAEKNLRVDGVSDIKEIINWHASGSTDRRSGSLVWLDRDDQELMRANFGNAWVCKTTMPDLDATADNNPMTFKFEIVMGTFEVV